MTPSAYDNVADWYEQWATGPSWLLQFGRRVVPDQLAGQRVLDVACGHGRLSRELADAGAIVVGVDVSARLIEKAEQAATGRSDICYLHADVGQPTEWWDGVLFDGATCEMALMDIADLDGAIRAVASVLRPGGRLPS